MREFHSQLIVGIIDFVKECKETVKMAKIVHGKELVILWDHLSTERYLVSTGKYWGHLSLVLSLYLGNNC